MFQDLFGFKIDLSFGSTPDAVASLYLRKRPLRHISHPCGQAVYPSWWSRASLTKDVQTDPFCIGSGVKDIDHNETSFGEKRRRYSHAN